jgi:hypothetical protein
MCGTFHYKGYSARGETKDELEQRLLSDYNNQLAAHKTSCEIVRTLKINQGFCDYCGDKFEKTYRFNNYYVGQRKIEEIEHEKLFEFAQECFRHVAACRIEHSNPRKVIFEKFKK